MFSGSLAAGIISEQGPAEEAPPILQHHMLKVALELPANKFLWLKAQVGIGHLQSSASVLDFSLHSFPVLVSEHIWK